MGMNFVQACGVVAKGKGPDNIIVATMGAMFIFDRIEGADGHAGGVPLVDGKLGLVLGLGAAKVKTLFKSAHAEAARRSCTQRINSVPLMGGASGLALGLAIAQPGKRVIVMDGDASLLMELGSLATVVSQQPRNFLHCVVNNGTQFSGLANMEVSAPGFNFAEVARAAGYRHAERISDGAAWAERFPQLLAMDGPVFVELMVDRLPQQTKDGFAQAELPANQYTRMGDEAVALQAWLA